MNNKKTLAHLAQVLVNTIFAINYIVAQVAMEQIGAFGIVALRVGFSAVFLTFYGLFFIKEKIEKKDYLIFFYCGIFGITINMLCFFKGLSMTTTINASLLMTVTPILVLIIAGFFIHERITLLKVVGILLGAGGVVLLLGGKNFNFSTNTIMGDILIIINAISYAVFLVIVKPITKKYQPITIITWTFIFGSIFTVPAGMNDLLLVPLSALSQEVIISVIYITIFVTIVTYTLNAWSLKYLDSSSVGSYIYLQPALTTLLSIFLGKDELTTPKIISGLMILTGVFLVNKRKYFRS